MRNARQPTPPQQQPSRTNSAEQNASKTAKFMIDQALHKDENNKDEDAMETYVDAAGLCLKMASIFCFLLLVLYLLICVLKLSFSVSLISASNF